MAMRTVVENITVDTANLQGQRCQKVTEVKNHYDMKRTNPYALVNCAELLNAATTMMVAIMTALDF